MFSFNVRHADQKSPNYKYLTKMGRLKIKWLINATKILHEYWQCEASLQLYLKEILLRMTHAMIDEPLHQLPLSVFCTYIVVYFLK